ncbi:ESPR-type extended signal peptide-containing protein, partial [Burkholderia cenocepacia]|nr:hypothetical protein [Burkholderia cenocepacia]
MNRSYRVVWNASTGTWAAASELTKSHKKSKSKAATVAVAVGLTSLVVPAASWAVESVNADGTTIEVEDETARTTDSEQDASLVGDVLSRVDATPQVSQSDAGAGINTFAVADSTPYVQVNGAGDGSDNAVAHGDRSLAIGSNAQTTVLPSGLGGAVALGADSRAESDNVAIGAGASASGDTGGVALGAGAKTSGAAALAIGQGASATGAGAFAVGRATEAAGSGATAFGDSAQATQDEAVAIGFGANAANVGSVAMGSGAVADSDYSVALGAFSNTNGRDMVVSVGDAGIERQVINVAAGTEGTDAVNVSQLKGVADALGGGSTVEENGKVKAPTYTLVDPADSS